MILWIISASLVAMCCVLLHTLTVRMLNPLAHTQSLTRFGLFFGVRLVVLGVYLWQLVQQNPLIIASSMAVFILIYWSVLMFVVRYKQDWIQVKETKDQTLWIP